MTFSNRRLNYVQSCKKQDSGLEAWNELADTRRDTRFFYVRNMLALNGRAVRGAERPAGCQFTGLLTCTVPPARLEAGAEV